MFYRITESHVMIRKHRGVSYMAYSNPIPSFDDELDVPESKDKNEIQKAESESDYIQMNEVYFAFIDVLGFKKTFDDIKISKEKDIANKYRDVFNYYFSLMNASKLMEAGNNTGCYAGQTSDSLYFYTERPDYLMQFIKIFSHFSLYAMTQNVFFRGGIAKGSLYKKEKYQFYGDSVIGAYLIESNISKNPIIIIDEKTDADMRKISGYKELVGTCQNRHYIKPFKYLNEEILLDIDENFVLKEINSELIETNIRDNKNAFEYDANNFSKYVFLLDELKKSNSSDLIGIE